MHLCGNAWHDAPMLAYCLLGGNPEFSPVVQVYVNTLIHKVRGHSHEKEKTEDSHSDCNSSK